MRIHMKKKLFKLIIQSQTIKFTSREKNSQRNGEDDENLI